MAAWEWKTYRQRHGLSDNPLVACRGLVRHRCGRQQSADMMLDVSHLPASVRGPSAYVCDACIWWLERDGVATRADIARAHGAPAKAVQMLARAQQEREISRAATSEATLSSATSGGTTRGRPAKR